MRRRKRIITTTSLRFQVVRGVLMGTTTLHDGARRLAMDIDDLAMLVVGARQAVIRALGEDALDHFEQQRAA